MSAPKTLAVLACLGLAACASPGRVEPERSSVSPEVVATSAFLQGRMLELEGRLAEAAEAYERAAAADPESPDLQRRLSRASPPGRWPTKARDSRISRSVMPALFIMLAARRKKGTANSTKAL